MSNATTSFRHRPLYGVRGYGEADCGSGGGSIDQRFDDDDSYGARPGLLELNISVQDWRMMTHLSARSLRVATRASGLARREICNAGRQKVSRSDQSEPFAMAHKNQLQGLVRVPMRRAAFTAVLFCTRSFDV